MRETDLVSGMKVKAIADAPDDRGGFCWKAGDEFTVHERGRDGFYVICRNDSRDGHHWLNGFLDDLEPIEEHRLPEGWTYEQPDYRD